MAKGFFVAHGKSITTPKRGIVAWDSEDPEITTGCMGADPKSEEDVAAATKRLKELVEAKALTFSEGVIIAAPPTLKAPEGASAEPAPEVTAGAKGGAKPKG